MTRLHAVILAEEVQKSERLTKHFSAIRYQDKNAGGFELSRINSKAAFRLDCAPHVA